MKDNEKFKQKIIAEAKKANGDEKKIQSLKQKVLDHHLQLVLQPKRK